MATRRTPQRHTPAKPAQSAPPDAPQVPETTGVDEVDDDDVSDDEKAPEPSPDPVDDAEPVAPAPTVTVYPRAQKNGPPVNSYIVEADAPVQESWFDTDDKNDNLVIPKKNIHLKVFPPNSFTPTYVLVASAGSLMSKQAVAAIGQPAAGARV